MFCNKTSCPTRNFTKSFQNALKNPKLSGRPNPAKISRHETLRNLRKFSVSTRKQVLIEIELLGLVASKMGVTTALKAQHNLNLQRKFLMKIKKKKSKLTKNRQDFLYRGEVALRMDKQKYDR